MNKDNSRTYGGSQCPSEKLHIDLGKAAEAMQDISVHDDVGIEINLNKGDALMCPKCGRVQMSNTGQLITITMNGIYERFCLYCLMDLLKGILKPMEVIDE